MNVILNIDHTVSKEEIENWIDEVLIPQNPCVWGYEFEKHNCENCKHEYWINTGGCYDQKCRFTGLDCNNWHDLRKNSADLPELENKDFSWSITVANQLGEACHYNYRKSRWETPLFTEIEDIIAWCELPTYKDKE